MTDITELAQSLKAAADREMICRDVAETSEIWERTVTPENILALVEALEKAQQRITQLESRTVNIKFAPIQVEELGNVRDGKKHPYMFGAGYNSAVIHCESVIQQELDAKGIKWEAE